MHIKSLVIDGFKTYAERTEIRGFDKNFNAITGLNGSGKSNILDAICFVLGISKLKDVRATNLQDLIYKSGQCGPRKATVSIIFSNDNPDQCPPGFEQQKEIIVSRQVEINGKSKYWINGALVPNKTIQDLFCSVQLNVNNPHFLIMQGRITKILNMKPADILSMIEEAAGTKMYEEKKLSTLKLIKRKDAKLQEIETMLTEEIIPRVDKLRKEKEQHNEFKSLERELEHSLKIFKAWEYFNSQQRAVDARKLMEAEEGNLQAIQDDIANCKQSITVIDEEVEARTRNCETEGNEKLHSLEAELKEAEKAQAKANAAIKSVKDNITMEEKRKKQLESSLKEDEVLFAKNEKALTELQTTFDQIRESETKDAQNLAECQKRFEALSAGMDLNEQGEAETIMEQLMNAKQEAAKYNTEVKKASMELDFCRSQLAEKKKKSRQSSSAGELLQDQNNLKRVQIEAEELEKKVEKLNFKKQHMDELQGRRRELNEEIRQLRDRVDIFEAQKPYMKFRYRDPEANFNRNRVYGVVCRLFDVEDDVHSFALETAAGGRLYNVVIDSDETGKKLLKNGDLQLRTTFIPFNKIEARPIKDSVVKFAKNLVGEDNVQLALSLIKYNTKLRPIMEFIFGNVLVCKNLNIARKLAFHPQVNRKCVTVDGDVVDPAGVLSGGSAPKGDSVLKQLKEIMQIEEQLKLKQKEMGQIEAELAQMNLKFDKFKQLNDQIHMKRLEINSIQQKLQLSSHYQQQEEINALTKKIDDLTTKIKLGGENEAKFNDKVKELELKRENSGGGRDKQMDQLAAEMKTLKEKADKFRQKYKGTEQKYETSKMELDELKNEIEQYKQQIQQAEETIRQLKEQYDEMIKASDVNERVANLQKEVKSEKAAIAEKNKELQKKLQKREQLQVQITEDELKIKKLSHTLKELKDDCKKWEAKLQRYDHKTSQADERYEAEAKKMSGKDGEKLEKRIRRMQEDKNNLGRRLNLKAVAMFEEHEKQVGDLKKKDNVIRNDRQKLITTIANLDREREIILKKAHLQISEDFNSIFNTILPDANARLVPPRGRALLEGLEVNVCLGGVWKESLSELSGGQRSLAALSLILAMLLFKPAPLYILDEVDAALDLSHTQNIGSMLKLRFDKSQFIVVSLKDGMFSNANVLFKTQLVDGVSTVSRVANKHNN